MKTTTRMPSGYLSPTSVRAILGILLEIAMVLTPVDRLAQSDSVIHSAQHGGILLGGLLIGTAGIQLPLRFGSNTQLALAALGLGLELAMILPQIDHLADRSPTFHQTQHGFIFFGGLLIGVSLRHVWRTTR